MLARNPFFSVIVVTYNSEKYISKNLECLQKQTRLPDEIVIVENGSDHPEYLREFEAESNIKVVYETANIGFCRANNVGWGHVDSKADYVFFLNPDVFLSPDFLERAISFMEDPSNCGIGAVTGTLLGYDIDCDRPSGKYDSTGLVRSWYGRWSDRGQGDVIDVAKYAGEEEILGICGAAFFCRKKALDEVLMEGSEIFDSTFYMYKEDIDLSIRLREKGWKLFFSPQLSAYHCRGWSSNRKKILRLYRLCSARNELKINLRQRSLFGVPYSLAKYVAVKVFDY